MFLKHVELIGFKSFADRTSLDFEAGITAIVGPNGCGKSNINDAIRWCLGEMSARSLRSNLMLDVVFNGSGTRPPQNLAEVTLTFDNADRRLPIDYTDVSVTRRLFRSGESEYYINKTQCRLRDIREMFLDTGMGEDGYAFMEQGKVEWILQAKPEERRELFEEAAGVSKYRARREEALRKLDKIEIDLSRLADIVAVTNEQIRRLENAVSKAKTYQRIREELKVMEIADWLAALARDEAALTALRASLGELQAEMERLTTATHTRDAELVDLRLQMTQADEELITANAALSGIDLDLRLSEERIANAARREADLRRQIEGLLETVARDETRAQDLRAQLAGQGEALQKVRDEGGAVEADFAAAQNRDAQALRQLEEKKSTVKEHRDRILDRAQERARLHHEMGNFSSDLSRYESQAESLEKDRARLAAERDELSAQRAAAAAQEAELAGQISEQNTGLGQIDDHMAGLTRKEAELGQRLMEVSERIAQIRGQIESIDAQQVNDPYLSGANAILAERLPGISGPLGRLIHTSDADRDVVVATLGEHLSDLVADTAEDAQRAVDFLGAQRRGRARIWILDRLPEGVESRPLGALTNGNPLLALVRTEERFRRLLAHLGAQLFVQGSTVYGTAFINGGIDPAAWKTHVPHRRPELEAALEEHERNRSELGEEAKRTDEDIAAANERRDAIRQAAQEMGVRLELIREEIAKLDARGAAIGEELRVCGEEVSFVDGSRGKARESLEGCRARFEDLQARERDDHERLDILQQEMADLQGIHATVNADLAAKAERHEAYQQKLEWHHGVLEHTRRDISQIDGAIHQQRDTIHRLEEETAGAKNAEGEARRVLETALASRSGAAERCTAIQGRRTELSERIQAADGEYHRLHTETRNLQEVLQEERIKETSLSEHNETCRQKLRDQYEMGIEEARAFAEPCAADPEALERLKKRVSGMGPINLAAPQEHAELLEKNTFLISQQADLLKAKEDIKQAIGKINATTRQHFRETFDKVRENFRTLYSQLFQGGEADLRLTDDNDILNSGIDIFCQPPGKKLLHISLLSGGEKALTACAILFAFFQVRPSPVALLDEVDAPLDEANVLRFVDLVKIFSEKSQFIVVTHNKRTMEAANALYGVTMQEFGVSKVLSARLQVEPKPAEETREPSVAAT